MSLPRALSRLPLPRFGAARARPLRVGVVGLSSTAVSALKHSLKRVGEVVGREFALGNDGRGELSLVDAHVAHMLDDEEWATLFGRRTVVAVVEDGLPPLGLRTAYWVSSAFEQNELAHTMRSIPELKSRRACDPVADRRWLAQAPAFVAALLQRRGDRNAPALLAGWPDAGALQVDFARGEALIEGDAWERLCVRRTIPLFGDPTFAPPPPVFEVKRLRLDSLLWALGLAAGELPLLGAPTQWRSAGLDCVGAAALDAYHCTPAHRHLVRAIGRGATTPAALRRMTGIDEQELRAFIQAGLFAGLLRWA